MKPTDELYQSLQSAYQHFNGELFESQLPEIIFTVQRQKGVLGYFAPERWSSVEGKHCHEIAINPSHLGQSRTIDVLQTLVHEMAHCWQHCFGTPSRGNYHNKEWAYKMIDIGLQPTSTGLPGGNIVGPQMSDYPIENGRFLEACDALVSNKSFTIPWIDRRPTPKSELHTNSATTSSEVATPPMTTITESIHNPINESRSEYAGLQSELATELMQQPYSALLPEDTLMPIQQGARTKKKYQCPECFNRVWGKPSMNIVCGDCNVRFEWISD